MRTAAHVYEAPYTSRNGQETKPTLQEVLPARGIRERLIAFMAKHSPANWEHVTVNKNVESVTMPRWVAIAIFGAVLAFGVQSWWSRQSEHDTLIEIRTELRLAKEQQSEKDRITNGKLGDLDAWQGVVNGKLSEIKGMLTQQQIDALNRLSKEKTQ